jgi:hypothetical protein
MNRIRLAALILMAVAALKLGAQYDIAPMADSAFSGIKLGFGEDVNYAERAIYIILLILSFFMCSSSNLARIAVLFWIFLYICALPVLFFLSFTDPLTFDRCEFCKAFLYDTNSLISMVLAIMRLIIFIFCFFLLWGQEPSIPKNSRY